MSFTRRGKYLRHSIRSRNRVTYIEHGNRHKHKPTRPCVHGNTKGAGPGMRIEAASFVGYRTKDYESQTASLISPPSSYRDRTFAPPTNKKSHHIHHHISHCPIVASLNRRHHHHKTSSRRPTHSLMAKLDITTNRNAIDAHCVGVHACRLALFHFLLTGSAKNPPPSTPQGCARNPSTDSPCIGLLRALHNLKLGRSILFSHCGGVFLL